MNFNYTFQIDHKDMITKEQFLTVIEVTKSYMDYDFLDKNQFIIIDIDMQHSKTYNELQD